MKLEKLKTILRKEENSTKITVIFGILYMLIIVGMTFLMDLFPVPDKDSYLFLLMGGYYLLMIVISILLEKLYKKLKIKVNRTQYYLIAQLTMLAAAIVFIIIGVFSESAVEVTSEFAYAMALVLSELVLLFYHLVRFIILRIFFRADNTQN